MMIYKLMMMFGLGGWMVIACVNNAIDGATNRGLIHSMVTMQLIKDNKGMGSGLLTRAWKPECNVSTILWCIVGLQGFIALSFLLAGTILSVAVFKTDLYPLGLLLANIALVGFNCLWLGFLSGGLWFGYWIHMSQVQTTHLLLLIVGLFISLIINLV